MSQKADVVIVIFRILRRIRRSIKRILDKILGTIADEWYWSYRHVFIPKDRKWAEISLSPEAINHPNRQSFVEKMSVYAPFETVLEIGAASGTNTYLFQKKFPDTKFYCTDVSRHAVEVGKKWFQEQSIKNVEFSVAKAEKLSQFSDKSIDIIFTSAVLMCVAPDKINNAIEEIVRVARRGFVFFEWHTNLARCVYDDHWIYNYYLLLEKFVSQKKVKITKLSPELWKGDWGRYGYIIEVELESEGGVN